MTRTFERVLIEVDPHTVHHPELDRGISIARATGAEVGVVGVMGERDLPAGPGIHIDTTDIDEFRALLTESTAGLHVASISTKVLFGSAAEALVEEAHRWGADLIVRSHPRVSPHPSCDLERDLIRSSPAPVLLVAPGVTASCPLILGAVAPETARHGGAALNHAVIEHTLSMAAIANGSPTLLQAFKPHALHSSHDSGTHLMAAVEHWRTDITKRLDEALCGLGADPRDVSVVARHGVVDEVLPEYVASHGVDLVVIGVPHRRGLAHWVLGSTATRLLRYLPCSVLAVKPDQRPSWLTQA